MPTLPLLARPKSYRPCIQDLLRDGEPVREYWLSLFERHAETLAALPVGAGRLDQVASWAAFRESYLAGLAALRQKPDARGILTVLELTRYRDQKLAEFHLGDPFHDLKSRENEVAIRQYPAVIADLESMPEHRRAEELARGLFAGNMFDMGSKAAVDAFRDGGGDFSLARSRVRSRPWKVDDFAEWDARRSMYRACLFLVDNAGPDIVLGVMPFVRELACGGARVVLAANSKPALNDVTADELTSLLVKLGAMDTTLNRLLSPVADPAMIRVVASGCESPLIDLTLLTAECCEAAGGCDLLVLEGMGRAIESNYDAEFTVDTLKIALIKDPMVAQTIGVHLFDPVFRFDCATMPLANNS